MLHLLYAATVSLLLTLASASPLTKRDFGPQTIFAPPSNYNVPRTLYARSLLLGDQSILATWENYTPNGTLPWFPIYRSTDHGYTWTNYSTIHDTQNGWGLRYQPHLLLLDQSLSGWASGTIFAAGNSIPEDLSKTQLDLYASKDSGKTWSFVSHIASGGRAIPNNGETPVWEPFLMVYNNQLVVYYSDQRDPSYGQKLVHQVSSDGGKTWGAVVNDVAVSPYSARPGMPVISKLPNGKYFYTYEYGGAPEGQFAVYFKISSDPLNFNAAPGQPLKATDGSVPTSSPYNVWTSIGPGGAKTTNGTIAVNSYSSGVIYTNTKLGQGPWTKLSTSSPGQYSRSLAVGLNPKDLLIVGGGVLNGNSNTVTAYARDVNGCSTC